MATFTGTAANETITPSTVSATVTRNPPGSLPSDASDSIYGNGGADRLDGGGGDDIIYGDDFFGTSTGNDTIFGGAGNDTIYTGNGSNTVDGGAGNDRIAGGSGADTITGGLGDDRISGEGGNDTITGGAGNDIIYGDDFFGTGIGNDTILYASATAGVTVNLSLTVAQNTIGAGIDTLRSLENLTGSNFNDNLIGNSGNNVLSGGGGNDTLNGGNGNDTLIGGGGTDTLTGGSGSDLFDYNSVNESPVGAGRDKIVGFTGNGALVGDRIDLTTIDANTLVAGNQTFTYIGGAAFTAAGQVRYAGGVLQGSTDADAAAEIEIQLIGTPALSVGGAGTDILL